MFSGTDITAGSEYGYILINLMHYNSDELPFVNVLRAKTKTKAWHESCFQVNKTLKEKKEYLGCRCTALDVSHLF